MSVYIYKYILSLRAFRRAALIGLWGVVFWSWGVLAGVLGAPGRFLEGSWRVSGRGLGDPWKCWAGLRRCMQNVKFSRSMGNMCKRCQGPTCKGKLAIWELMKTM